MLVTKHQLQKSRLITKIAVILLVAVSFASKATLILPGETVNVPAVTAMTNPELAGTVINNDAIRVNLFDDNIFVANYEYQNQVIRSDADGSTIIAPQLTWLNNITLSDFFIDQILLDGYAGVETSIFYRTDAMGDRGPTSVERSGNGDQLFFTFGFPLFLGNLNQEPQENSFPINILTDANDFELTGTATIFARSTENISETFTITIQNVAVPIYANLPPQDVPSPNSMAFLLLGLVAISYKRRAF